MATASSSFRSSNKARSHWPHDDDLFDQFIDPEPLSLGDSSSSEAVACESSLVDLSDFGRDKSTEEDEDDDTGGIDISGSHQHPFSGDESCESAVDESNSAVPRELEDIENVLTLLACDQSTIASLANEASSAGPTPPAPYPYLPLTPPPLSPFLTDAISSSESARSERVTTGTVRRLHRKTKSSPAMAQPTSAHRDQNHWAQRLEARAELFEKRFQNGPVSPPPSATLGQWDDSMAFNNQGYNANSSLQQAEYHLNGNNGYAAHQTSSGQQYAQNQNASFVNADSHPNSMITSPQVDRTLSWDGGCASPFQFSLDSTSMQQSFDDTEVQPWWPPNSMTYTEPGLQSFPPQQRRTLRQDSMPPHQSYNSPTSQSMAGLMINNGGLGSPLSPVPCVPYQHQQSQIVYPSDPVEIPNQQSQDYRRRKMSSYNSASHSQSSRSSSPTRRTRTPSMPHQNSSSSHRRAASRSRSTHPNSAAVDTHAHHQNGQGHHRRSKSQSAASARSPTKSASASAASGANVSNVGFVNFTPQDSRRILTGVAPSGSSKTKARREKEAAEKRRKFSLAATRAVIQAGGDARALEREGLYGVV